MSKTMKTLSKRRALVTGGAHRLGKILTSALARQGCNVVIHYHTSGKDAEETAEICRELGVTVHLIEWDLSNPDKIGEFFHEVSESAGPIDFLINSASMYQENRAESVRPGEFQDAMNLNAFSPFFLSRAFAEQDRPGHIINILDGRIKDYDRRHISYSLSKQTLFSLTRILCEELAPQIQVNAIAPGIVLPPEGTSNKKQELWKEGNLLKKIGDPEEITAALVFLLKSEFITGQVLFLDGGRHLKGSFYGT